MSTGHVGRCKHLVQRIEDLGTPTNPDKRPYFACRFVESYPREAPGMGIAMGQKRVKLFGIINSGRCPIAAAGPNDWAACPRFEEEP